MTSELDSESLSTLWKIIFKRDSCKVDELAAPVITSCAKCLSVNFKKIHKVTKCFKKFQKISKNFKIFQFFLKFYKKIEKVNLPVSVFRLLALAGGLGLRRRATT